MELGSLEIDHYDTHKQCGDPLTKFLKGGPEQGRARELLSLMDWEVYKGLRKKDVADAGRKECTQKKTEQPGGRICRVHVLEDKDSSVARAAVSAHSNFEAEKAELSFAGVDIPRTMLSVVRVPNSEAIDGWTTYAREDIVDKYPANMEKSDVNNIASWELLSIAMGTNPIPVKDVNPAVVLNHRGRYLGSNGLFDVLKEETTRIRIPKDAGATDG